MCVSQIQLSIILRLLTDNLLVAQLVKNLFFMDYDVHYHAHNNQPHVFMLSQTGPFHPLISCIKHSLVTKVMYFLLFCEYLNAFACLLPLLLVPIITINNIP